MGLKYLMVSYICKPPKFVGKPADDVDTADAESKLLTDSSSKELMGLLEKHLNEIKDGALEKKPAEPAQPAVRDILSRGDKPLFASEDEDVASALLNSAALARELKQDVNARRKDETP